MMGHLHPIETLLSVDVLKNSIYVTYCHTALVLRGHYGFALSL